MTVGQEFKAFSVLLKEETKSILHTAQLLLEVNLGATAIGTRLNTPEGYQRSRLTTLHRSHNYPSSQQKT